MATQDQRADRINPGGITLTRDEQNYYHQPWSHWSDPWAELGAYLWYGSQGPDLAPHEKYPNMWSFWSAPDNCTYVGYWIDLGLIWRYTGTKAAFASRYDLFDRMIQRPIWGTQSGLRGRWVIVLRDSDHEDFWCTVDTFGDEVQYNSKWEELRIEAGVPAE